MVKRVLKVMRRIAKVILSKINIYECIYINKDKKASGNKDLAYVPMLAFDNTDNFGDS